MARPNQEAIETFMSITGASDAVAVQKLEEHGGDLNAAVNAHFSEGDRRASSDVREAPVAAQTDLMDIDDPVRHETWAPPLSRLPAAQNLNPFSLLDPSFRRSIFDGGPNFMNSEPFVTHPREVREIPVEVKDGNQPSGHSGHAPRIEDVTDAAETERTQGPYSDIHGTVIVDDEDEVPAGPAAQVGQQREQRDDISHDGSPDQFSRPSAPRFDEVPDYSNDIEEQMIRAAIEASKREVDEGFPNQPVGAESDLNHLGPGQRQPQLEDAELERAVSLSLKTAEQEKALREQETNLGESSGGASNPIEVDLDNVAATNGRLETGKSSIQDEVEDLDEQPLVRHRSRRMSSGSLESAKEVGAVEDSPPPSPRQPNRGISPVRNGDAFPSEDWGGISSLEHDEAVMLEAAMFGGIPEGTGYHFPYAPPQFVQSERPYAPYPRPVPRPPSPSLTAQRLIREQQDDEYLASLQADREKEQRAREEAEARLEEKRRKEEESRRKLEEEKELERLLAAKEATLPQEPASDDENSVTLLVRMPDGSRRGRRFLKSDKLQSLFDFIDIGRGVKPGSYRLVRPYPRRAFEDGESGLTLSELGLTSKQEALYMELI